MQRDVAQLGSAPLWGSGGLGFKSQHSDFVIKKQINCRAIYLLFYVANTLSISRNIASWLLSPNSIPPPNGGQK